MGWWWPYFRSPKIDRHGTTSSSQACRTREVHGFHSSPTFIMTTVNVYLTFKGNCEEAFNFYKKAFGRDFQRIDRFGAMPPSEGMASMPADQKNKIMHVSLPISKETFLMGSDSLEGFGQPTIFGNNFFISIHTDDRGEADRLFKTLSEGGQVTMPLQDTFWGAYWGMFIDRYGIGWQVNMDQRKG